MRSALHLLCPTLSEFAWGLDWEVCASRVPFTHFIRQASDSKQHFQPTCIAVKVETDPKGHLARRRSPLASQKWRVPSCVFAFLRAMGTNGTIPVFSYSMHTFNLTNIPL